VKEFGISALDGLMIDFDHAVMFCDLGVIQLLELGERKPSATLPQRFKSQIRYCDKKRVMRFRVYATNGPPKSRRRWCRIDRQRTLNSFFSVVGARGPAAPAQLETPAADPADVAPAPHASTGDPADGDAEAPEHPRDASAARRSEATAASPHAWSHDIDAIPMPWGEKPKQGALRSAVTSFDPDGRCSYEATHKCRSAAWHWLRFIVVDHPDVVV
jgi:hypothetical protein